MKNWGTERLRYFVQDHKANTRSSWDANPSLVEAIVGTLNHSYYTAKAVGPCHSLERVKGTDNCLSLVVVRHRKASWYLNFNPCPAASLPISSFFILHSLEWGMQDCWSLHISITLSRISKMCFILPPQNQTFLSSNPLKEINVTTSSCILSPSHIVFLNPYIHSLYYCHCASGSSPTCRSKINNNNKITTIEVPLISGKW